MNTKIKYTLIGGVITIALLLPFFVGGAFHSTERITQIQTDTIYIDRPYKVIEIQKEVIEKPVKVFVYKTDTIYRKQLEKDTLLSAVKLTPKKAIIHTLTPQGIPHINQYTMPPFSSLTLTHKGKLQIIPEKHPRRKKTLRTIGAITIFATGVFLGTQIHK